MCRTHTTQHELSAIAPNVQWEQLFASPRLPRHRRHQPRHRCRGLCARAHTRGCTLLHALPARKRLRRLSPHTDLPTPSVRPPARPPLSLALSKHVFTTHWLCASQDAAPIGVSHAPLRRAIISCEGKSPLCRVPRVRGVGPIAFEQWTSTRSPLNPLSTRCRVGHGRSGP